MAFFATSQDVRIEDGHILKARLQRVDGEWVDAELDLNRHISNNDGRLCWDGEGFAHSAENIVCSVEGTGPVCVLRAACRNMGGELCDSDLNLSERLSNQDGRFAWREFDIVVCVLAVMPDGSMVAA